MARGELTSHEDAGVAGRARRPCWKLLAAARLQPSLVPRLCYHATDRSALMERDTGTGMSYAVSSQALDDASRHQSDADSQGANAAHSPVRSAVQRQTDSSGDQQMNRREQTTHAEPGKSRNDDSGVYSHSRRCMRHGAQIPLLLLSVEWPMHLRCWPLLLAALTACLCCNDVHAAGQSRVRGMQSRLRHAENPHALASRFNAESTATLSANCSWVRGGSDCWTAEVAAFYSLSGGGANLTFLPIPAYQQFYDYTCGPTATMNIFRYYGYLTDAQMNPQTEMQFATAMQSNPATGTEVAGIVGYVSSLGWKVQSGVNAEISFLRASLAAGIPVLIEWVDWGGHYVVVSGYNVGSSSYLNDMDALFLADSASSGDIPKSLRGLTVVNPDRFFGMYFELVDVAGAHRSSSGSRGGRRQGSSHAEEDAAADQREAVLVVPGVWITMTPPAEDSEATVATR